MFCFHFFQRLSFSCETKCLLSASIMMFDQMLPHMRKQWWKHFLFFKPYVTRNLFNVRDLKGELTFKWNDIFKFCLNFYGIQNKNQPHQSVHNKWIKWCLFVILLFLCHHLLINVTLYFQHLECSSPSSPVMPFE